jgi:hypothetical protein
MVKVVEDVVTVVQFVLLSVRGIQNNQVVAVRVLHVLPNVLLSVKDKPLKDVQIAHHSVQDPVIRHVKQDVAGNAIGHVVALATNNARAIV